MTSSAAYYSGEGESEDDIGLRTPKFLRRASRFTRSTATGTPSSISSPLVTGSITEAVLQIWNQLPDAIKMDPSLILFQREYQRIFQLAGKSLQATEGLNDEEEAQQDQEQCQESKQNPFHRYAKLSVLTFCWIIFTVKYLDSKIVVLLLLKETKIESRHQISLTSNHTKDFLLPEPPQADRIGVSIEGSLLSPLNSYNSKSNVSRNLLMVWVEVIEESRVIGDGNQSFYRNVCVKLLYILSPCKIQFEPKLLQKSTEEWTVELLPTPVELAEMLPAQKRQWIFQLEATGENSSEFAITGSRKVAIKLRANVDHSNFPIFISFNLAPIDTSIGIVYAAAILIGLYILIIFEVVHRALAAMLASTMGLAILAALNERPTMAEIISWIDMDTLILLFSMMVLVTIIAETGVFDYLAVYAYKITNGRLWPLMTTLCFFTSAISSFLDNVTTVLLMTPVTIRLCEVMELNPIPILTSMIVFSNIGGAMTPVGDPPNVVIASNRDVINAGVGFSTFALHMSIGVGLVLVVVYAQLRFIFRDVAVLHFDEPQEVQELRHEIAIWQRAAASLSSYSKEENLVKQTLMRKVRRLLSHLKKKIMTGSVASEKYKATLEELQEKYPIRDKWLLIKSGLVLAFVIILFFLHNLPMLHLSLGWTALVGVLLLLVLADGADLDGILARVEWSTLLFFACLFVLMETLSRLGLIAWIGKLTETLILAVDEDSRLAMAILLLLWVSSLTSAFVDNVPLTTMMIRIATGLAENRELRLPLQPLVWALAFGACMGGNGTLIGATANVVCAGVAEQHGYRFSFMQFFKVGFPVMLTSTTTITVYLMVAHVLFEWNG